MPRRPRIVVPGFPHHITNRGNRKSPIILADPDYRVFLDRLQQYAAEHEVRILSYCLMANHIHLVGVPPERQSLSELMHDLDGSYAELFNRRYRQVGHLWQDRFFACVSDDDHLWNAVRYVEQNPWRAGLVGRAEEYRWSSAAARCGLRQDPILDPNFPPAGIIADWSNWLNSGLPAEVEERIREATRQGIPCGSHPFVRQLESWLGIPLLPRPRCRKAGA